MTTWPGAPGDHGLLRHQHRLLRGAADAVEHVDPGAGAQKGVFGRGVDPYGITGEILARVAGRVLRGEHRATGVVSPAQAFEPEDLLASLADLGVSWGST